jgi:hypothetical protein
MRKVQRFLLNGLLWSFGIKQARRMKVLDFVWFEGPEWAFLPKPPTAPSYLHVDSPKIYYFDLWKEVEENMWTYESYRDHMVQFLAQQFAKEIVANEVFYFEKHDYWEKRKIKIRFLVKVVVPENKPVIS